MSEAARTGIVAAVAVTGALVLVRTVSTEPPPLEPRPPSARHLQSHAPRTDVAGYVGVVLSETNFDISPQREGILAAVPVRIGQRVLRGELLASLDDAPVRREVAAAKARLATIESEQARAALEHAQSVERETRATRLAEYISLEDRSSVAYATRLAAARLAGLDGAVKEQQMAIDQLIAKLADSELRAPVDGVIAERLLERGALADRTSAVVRLIGSTPARVRFAIPEESLPAISLGTRVRVDAARLGLTVRGRVDTIAPQLDPASRTLIAEVALDAAPEALTSGALVRVFLENAVATDDR